MTAETDGRRARGAETRARVLERASADATVEGLNGLSMAHLADALQLSKSGVHALFGTKEDLQLATVVAARRRFIDVVITPIWQQAAGLPRLYALTESWLDYVRRREFPGGCFVTRWSAEFATHPGRVRDALAEARADWLELITSQLAVAVRAGDIRPGADLEQLAFELDAVMVAGNNGALIGDDTALDRAADAVQRLLQAAGAPAAAS